MHTTKKKKYFYPKTNKENLKQKTLIPTLIIQDSLKPI